MKHLMLFIGLIILSTTAYSQGLILIQEPVKKEAKKRATPSSSGYSQGFGISKKKKKTNEKVDQPYWVVPAKYVLSCYWHPKKQSVICTCIGTSQWPTPYFFRLKMEREKSLDFIKKVLDTSRKEILEVKADEVLAHVK